MRRCGRSLVQRVSITAGRGELLVLCGPAGSGTRTLLHLLPGHLQTDTGRGLDDGRERSPRLRSDPRRPDPRHLAHGPDESTELLAAPVDATPRNDTPELLLERPTVGLEAADCNPMLVAARRRADEGCGRARRRRARRGRCARDDARALRRLSTLELGCPARGAGDRAPHPRRGWQG